jgi:hypothetical protein
MLIYLLYVFLSKKMLNHPLLFCVINADDVDQAHDFIKAEAMASVYLAINPASPCSTDITSEVSECPTKHERATHDTRLHISK